MIRRRLVVVFSITLALFLAYSAVGEKGLIRLHRMVVEKEDLQARIRTLENENSRLAEEIGLLRDDETAIESLARIELGLVKPGETVYILPDIPLDNK